MKKTTTFGLDPENLKRWQQLAAKGEAGAFLNRCIRQDAKAYLTKLARDKRHFKRGLRHEKQMGKIRID